MEFRFYEVPQNERVLPLLGESWDREYGNDAPLLHFHNLMEIGYCIRGEGLMILDGVSVPYGPGMLTVLPENYPHNTISKENTRSYWEYLFFSPKDILRENYPDDRFFVEQLEKQVNEGEQHYQKGQNEELVMLVKMIMGECSHRKKYADEMIRGLLHSLVLAIARRDGAKEQFAGAESLGSRCGIYRISAALEYISNRYMEDIKLQTLARCCNLSETHFRRLFVEYMNMTPIEYINLVRIQQAQELIRRKQWSMEEIAERVGYTAVSTFNRNFKKIIGTSPYQYKLSRDNYQGKQLHAKVLAKKGW